MTAKRKLAVAMAALVCISCVPMGGTGAPLIKIFPDGAPMIRVAKGQFVMGDNDGEADERPAHPATIEAYWIDQYEITNARYDECVKAGKCKDNEEYKGFSDPNQPVVGVSWTDASDFCAFVLKRLPTEAEWERAARGVDSRPYPWGATLDCAKANYRECGRGATTVVGSYPDGASPIGALDMAGNAAEWVADWYDAGYYKTAPPENPKGPDSGKYRSLRGGMWSRYAYLMKSSDRAGQGESTRNDYTGFRCAKDIR